MTIDYQYLPLPSSTQTSTLRTPPYDQLSRPLPIITQTRTHQYSDPYPYQAFTTASVTSYRSPVPRPHTHQQNNPCRGEHRHDEAILECYRPMYSSGFAYVVPNASPLVNCFVRSSPQHVIQVRSIELTVLPSWAFRPAEPIVCIGEYVCLFVAS